MHERDKRVVVIELSRNFGQHKALMTGLSHAGGDYVFMIQVDLEEEPELLTEFWHEMQQHNNIDVVYGIQQARKGSWWEKFSGGMFYWLFNLFSSIRIPANPLIARIMCKNYVSALLQHKEQELFFAGLWALTGFNQKGIEVIKHSHSPTTYSLTHKIAIFIKYITAFSNKPLVWIFYSGFVITCISVATIVYLISQKLLFDAVFSGWTSVLTSIWLLGGIMIFSIGVVGIYISTIFLETKNRPYSIIRKIYK